MDLERMRAFCLKLPGTTEDIQWGNDLLFRIGGKIYATACLEPAPTSQASAKQSSARLSLKCTPEEFAELTEQDGIVPAAYVARYHWVSLERWDALSDGEIERLIRDSYEMVRAKLPKRVREKLAAKKQRLRRG